MLSTPIVIRLAMFRKDLCHAVKFVPASFPRYSFLDLVAHRIQPTLARPVFHDDAAAALLDYDVYYSDPGHGRTESRRA